MRTFEITDWDSLKPWLPGDSSKPVTSDFLKSLGFGHDDAGELDEATNAFVEACTGGLTEINVRHNFPERRVYAVRVDMNPRAYPDIEKLPGGEKNENYWASLGDARGHLLNLVGELDILNEYGGIFSDFRCHWTSKRRTARGERRELNWEPVSHDDSVLYLLSDWSAGYWRVKPEGTVGSLSVFGWFGKNDIGYSTPWEAFVAEYVDLLGIALLTWWVPSCLNQDTVLDAWRFNLGQCIGGTIEEIDHSLGLCVLFERLEVFSEDRVTSWTRDQREAHLARGGVVTKSLGWRDPGDFAMQSNSNVEILPVFVTTMQELLADTKERVAESLRVENGSIVIVTESGDIAVLSKNGRVRETINLRDFMLRRIQSHQARSLPPEGLLDHPMLADNVLSLLAVVMNAAARMPSPMMAVHEIIRAFSLYKQSEKGVKP